MASTISGRTAAEADFRAADGKADQGAVSPARGATLPSCPHSMTPETMPRKRKTRDMTTETKKSARPRLVLDPIDGAVDPRPDWIRPYHQTTSRGLDLEPQTRDGIADNWQQVGQILASIAPWARNRGAVQTGGRASGQVTVTLPGRALLLATANGDPKEHETAWSITYDRPAFPDLVPAKKGRR